MDMEAATHVSGLRMSSLARRMLGTLPVRQLKGLFAGYPKVCRWHESAEPGYPQHAKSSLASLQWRPRMTAACASTK